MPLNQLRLKQLQLLRKLAQEAGRGHLLQLSMLSTIGSLSDIAGLGLSTLLLGEGWAAPLPLTSNLPLPAVLGLLVGLVLLRGQLQARVASARSACALGSPISCASNNHQVFAAPSAQLDQLGRGDLLGLLMADISRTF